ncbi:RDD family protein [Sphingobacterium sp. SRCM116780]|uniref:RDD family protein n=1 Tax=Sphingobacterium sp. SRCM116780 TaxID=2907623 RepID=UPI001F425C93|nr:RDD family protein [Sphingobacterium sp. SRCM116780]UIR57915.1 RDD family protein [Sphingobacterium sp. SRCM116780]
MLIIFGTKSIGKTVKYGNFHCPRCQMERPYQLKQNRRYFSLFFIPMIPLEKQGDTLECNFCRTAYIPASILPASEYTSSTLNIDGLTHPLASFGQRIGSYFIDLVVLILLNFPLATLTTRFKDYLPENYFLVFLPVWALYFFLMEWLLKGTLGKKICGIKIVSDTEGKSVTIFQYLIRSIIKTIPIINMILFFNDKRKGCHDFAANTIVVETK